MDDQSYPQINSKKNRLHKKMCCSKDLFNRRVKRKKLPESAT